MQNTKQLTTVCRVQLYKYARTENPISHCEREVMTILSFLFGISFLCLASAAHDWAVVDSGEGGSDYDVMPVDSAATNNGGSGFFSTELLYRLDWVPCNAAAIPPAG